MKSYFTDWIKAAGIRSAKTMAQTMLSGITIGAALSEINWKYLISVSIVAGVYSILTSIAGLPEVPKFEGENGNDHE